MKSIPIYNHHSTTVKTSPTTDLQTHPHRPHHPPSTLQQTRRLTSTIIITQTIISQAPAPIHTHDMYNLPTTPKERKKKKTREPRELRTVGSCGLAANNPRARVAQPSLDRVSFGRLPLAVRIYTRTYAHAYDKERPRANGLWGIPRRKMQSRSSEVCMYMGCFMVDIDIGIIV